MTETEELQIYLQPTFFIDSDSEAIRSFTNTTCQGETTDRGKAIALYYRVRDQIRYDPFDLRYSREAMQASAILTKKSGYCVAKALLLAAAARCASIPARLGFADVTNHLSTNRLRKLMGTNLFIYHGYTEILLEGRWVKATPAFNLSLCQRFGVLPLEFDGRNDSIFHPFDAEGRKHMEYVRDRGHYADLPFDEMFAAYGKNYPGFFETFGKGSIQADFEKEADAEQKSNSITSKASLDK